MTDRNASGDSGTEGGTGDDAGDSDDGDGGTTEYDTLVRDRIPEIVRETGAEPETHVADDAEFRHRLGEKLVEEAREYAESDDPEELADVLAVVGAICRARGIDREELEEIGREKAMERGTFSERIVLKRVRE